MSRWAVDLIRIRAKQLGTARLLHLGTVQATNDKEAIEAAIKQFHIDSARQKRIVVTKISERDED
jgi:hypothetical protein